VVAPWRGEFGLGLRYHVPTTYALEGEYFTCIEPGSEALYPGAAGYIEVPRRDDDARAGNPYRTDRAFLRRLATEHGTLIEPRKGDPERRFIPEPFVRQSVTADVVICPRGRKYGSSKNWPHWDELAAKLQADGLTVFAAGAPDSSLDAPCVKAWDSPRFLDASIEAMLSARLVIATDAGLAHLAVLCGRPLLMVTYKGLVAPGPVTDENGKVFGPEYWPVKFQDYYQQANHMRSWIHRTGDWDDVESVVRDAISMARTTRVPV
jgi:hypothetical protein